MPITYTNEFKTFLDLVRGLLQTEFPTVTILLGDEKLSTVKPTIVMEPELKRVNSEVTTQKKDLRYVVLFLVYLFDANQENAMIRLTDQMEHLEQLLENNKKYPTDSGNSWHNSEVEAAEYGQIERQGQFFRVARLRWTAVSRRAL